MKMWHQQGQHSDTHAGRFVGAALCGRPPSTALRPQIRRQGGRQIAKPIAPDSGRPHRAAPTKRYRGAAALSLDHVLDQERFHLGEVVAYRLDLAPTVALAGVGDVLDELARLLHRLDHFLRLAWWDTLIVKPLED